MNNSEKNTIEEAMKILDGTEVVVKSMTGIKKQFMAAGWSELSAEQMVVQMLAVSANSSNDKT